MTEPTNPTTTPAPQAEKPAAALAQRATEPLTLEPTTLQQAMLLSSQLAKSELIPKALQGKPNDVLIVLLTAKELGIGPMTALRGVHVMDGKPVFSAQLAVALIQRRRELCEYFRLVESTAQKAVFETKRVGAAPVRMEWTIQQAEKAKLVGRDNWQKYPEAMLRSRCAMDLARTVYQDLMNNCYDPDEAADFDSSREINPAPQRRELVVQRDDVDPETGEVTPTGAVLGDAVDADYKRALRNLETAANQKEALAIMNKAPRHIQKLLGPVYRERWATQQ